MIDRNSPIPIYYQLIRHFKQLIEAGNLTPGDRLPTEAELCVEYDISRAPVRRALTDLAREGFVYRRPGQGTFVKPASQQRLQEQTRIQLIAHYDVRWLDMVEQAVYLWNQLHPEQEARLEVIMCSRAEFHQVLQRNVIQGKAPDLAPMDCVWVMGYAASGYIMPFDRLDRRWAAELREQLEPEVLQSNLLGDALYGLPVQADLTGLWYRRDWFTSEGVAPPATWDEWLTLLDYFARADVRQRLGHQYAVAFPVSATVGEATFNTLLSFFWTSGAITRHEDYTPAVLDSVSAHKTLHFLQQITLKRCHILPENMTALHWWEFPSLLSSGKSPMILGGTYEWPRIQEETAWEDEFEVMEHLGFTPAPRPAVDVNPVCSLGGTSWAILEQSPVSEICLEILKLAGSAGLSTNFCIENLQISPYRTVNERLATAKHPWLSTIIPLLQWARRRPVVRNYNQISHFIQEMVEHVLWDGMPIEETTRRTAQLLSLLID